MFAIIRTGGKQYKVKKDDKLLIEKLELNQGDEVKIDDVLFVIDGKTSTIGAPTVAGAMVTAKSWSKDHYFQEKTPSELSP